MDIGDPQGLESVGGLWAAGNNGGGVPVSPLRFITLPGLLLAIAPALAYDLFDPSGQATITFVDRQLNSSSWAAANLLDDQTSTRWLSNRHDNDIIFAFDGQKTERCFSRFDLENYGGTRSVREFMLLHTMDATLAGDTGPGGWTRIVADANPTGPVNHLHWGQGGRLTGIDSELNSSNWAAAHINNGNTGDFWLSSQANNRLDFAFDTDWDGNVGDAIDVGQLALHNYGGSRSIRFFQVEVSTDGATWQKLEVPGSDAGDPDFNYALKHEGGSLDTVSREINGTSWAAANIHDGARQTIWLSDRANNRLDFSFDPDGDGSTGLAGDTGDRFTLEKIVLENYGSARSVREFQILVKTSGNPNWSAVAAPGAAVGQADFNFMLSHHGASLTAIDRELNSTGWAAPNIHDGASQTIWLSSQANNLLDFEFDIDGDGSPGGAGDRFAIQKIALENYGGARSMKDFQVEVRTASVPAWTRIEVPGTAAGDPGFNFLSKHEGGTLSSISSQLNAGSYAAANVHDGSPLSLWLSNRPTNTLEFTFDTDLDGNAADAVNISTLRMQNHGGARSVSTFEIDVRIGGGAWQAVTAPGGGTVFNAAQDMAPQVWTLAPQTNVTAFRLRTLGNHGDTYTGLRELELLGNAVGPGHTFTAAQDAAEQLILLSPVSRPSLVTAVRLRSINNYGDTYTGVREFKVLGDSITRSRTFVAQQRSAEQVFAIAPEDRPSGVTAVRLQTISNHGDTYTGVRELHLLGPSVSASHNFEATDSKGRQIFTLDSGDGVANVVAARLLTLNNFGDSYVGAREFELLGNAVGPSYLFTADQAAANQSWAFSPVTARLFRLHTLDNYGDTYIGAIDIGLDAASTCGPLALWHMDEQNWGSVLDSSGNGIVGIAANGGDTADSSPVFSGSPGTCRYGEFDGLDDYLSFPAAPNLTGSFTIAAWIRADVLGKDQRIFADDRSNSGGYAFSLGDGGNGRLRFFSRSVRPAILDSPAVITRQTWHFVAVVHDAASRTRKIYVDGGLTPVAEDTYAGTWGVDNGPVTVGGEADGTSEGNARWRFDGAIDEVMVYQRPLGSGELAALKDQTHLCGPVVNPNRTAFAFSCIEPGADAITGHLRTKSVGSAFAFDIAALRDSDGDSIADAVETQYAQNTDRAVTVELVDTSSGGGCVSFPGLNPPVSVPLTFQAGDAGRRKHAAVTLNRAYRSLGCRVTDANGAQPLVGCSTDSFSVRPTNISLLPPALDNAGVSGTPMMKVGSGFSLSVSAGPGYDGTPSIGAGALEAHAGAVAIGNLSGGFASADPATGIATGTGFDYSEVGNFRFAANAIRDTGFSAVDQPADCIPGSVANTPDGNGRIGCEFSNTMPSAWIGRFIPDHFDVAVTDHGMLANTCTGFSYAGTGLVYSVDPTISIIARGPAGNTTHNYTGAYSKLDTSEVILSSLSGDATTMGADGSTPVAVGLVPGSRHLEDNGDGSFALRFSGDRFTFARGPNERVGEFLADVSRDLVAVTDTEDGTTAAGLPLSLSPTGVPIRYGRLNIANAHGSELQTLPMSMRVEYFAGASSGFQVNPADGCTVINAMAIADGDSGDGLPPNATCVWDATGSSGVFACGSPGDVADQYHASPVSGDFNLNLMAPSGAATGVLRVTADAPPWLEFDWQGSGNSDPVGLATFGIYQGNSRVIFMREVR